MPADALPIPWDDPARRDANAPVGRADKARTITGSSRTTTVNPRE